MNKTKKTSKGKPDKKLTDKQEMILLTKAKNPRANGAQIAKLAGVEQSYTIDILKRYGLTTESIKDYQEHKASIWDGIAHRLLSNVSQEDIEKAGMYQKVLAAGIAQSKVQEIKGLNPEARPMIVVVQNRISTGQVEGNEVKVIDVTPKDVVNSTQSEAHNNEENAPLTISGSYE
jgi:hypothetical protein